jgi:hypothetical protein
MSRTALIIVICLLTSLTALSQTTDPPKYEVAAEFAATNRDDFSGSKSDMGFGGRFTFNVNKYFALESAAYFFPADCFSCVNNGRAIQAVGGGKVGKRFQSWGIFAKARPGVVSFSRGQFNVVPTNQGGQFPFQFQSSRLTSFATDVGGVLEFYPSKRIVTRFDAGDTMIHFSRQTRNALAFDPLTNTYTLFPIPTPARTSHNFQFTASVGFRF